MAGLEGVYPKASKTAFLVSLSVLFMYLCQPGGPLPWLTWLALVPTGLSIHGCQPRRSAVILYLHGLGWWLVSTWWLMPAIIHFTELKAHFAILCFLSYCAVSALPYGVLGGLLGLRSWLNQPFGVAIVAAFYTVVVSWAAGALPGNHAHGLYVYPVFIQIADLGGVPLVLFSVVFVNWQFVKGILLVKERGLSVWRCGMPFLKATLLLICIGLYGHWQLNAVNETQLSMERSEALALTSSNTSIDPTLTENTLAERSDRKITTSKDKLALSLGFVQPNLVRDDSIDRLFKMSDKLLNEHPDIELLIWPEFPTAFSYIESMPDKERVDAFVQDHEVALALVSGYVFETLATDDNPMPRYYNTAHLIAADGTLVGSYSKQKLAPFYEFLPWEDQWPILRDLFPGVLRYRAGEEARLLSLNEGIRIIPQICYEIVFPEISHEMIKQGGNIIINFTNDYWLGNSRGSAYHFSLGLFRAVEHKVPLVRATNTGISAVVDAAGRIQEGSETGLFESDARTVKVQWFRIRTLYSTWGNWFLSLSTGFVLLLVVGLSAYQCSALKTRSFLC